MIRSLPFRLGREHSSFKQTLESSFELESGSFRFEQNEIAFSRNVFQSSTEDEGRRIRNQNETRDRKVLSFSHREFLITKCSEKLSPHSFLPSLLFLSLFSPKHLEMATSNPRYNQYLVNQERGLYGFHLIIVS